MTPPANLPPATRAATRAAGPAANPLPDHPNLVANPGIQLTTLNRPWLARMIIFWPILVFFGLWGLWDGTVRYPNRGIRHAEYMEFAYLDQARSRGELDSRLAIEDPEGAYERLRELERRDAARLGAMESARLDWLRSLDRVGRIAPQFTDYRHPEFVRGELAAGEPVGPVDVRQRYDVLRQRWTTAEGAVNAPKALTAYDIPAQWLFVIAGFGGAAYMTGLFVTVRRRRYAWDPDEHKLYLPGGATLTPDDLEEVDKRKWHKFLVFLRIKPGHPQFGGQELRLDLFRHHPLEEWVLEMERIAFPENVQEEEAGAEDGETAEEERSDEVTK